jgi:hypothetical protein
VGSLGLSDSEGPVTCCSTGLFQVRCLALRIGGWIWSRREYLDPLRGCLGCVRVHCKAGGEPHACSLESDNGV